MKKDYQTILKDIYGFSEYLKKRKDSDRTLSITKRLEKIVEINLDTIDSLDTFTPEQRDCIYYLVDLINRAPQDISGLKWARSRKL